MFAMAMIMADGVNANAAAAAADDDDGGNGDSNGDDAILFTLRLLNFRPSLTPFHIYANFNTHVRHKRSPPTPSHFLNERILRIMQ